MRTKLIILGTVVLFLISGIVTAQNYSLDNISKSSLRSIENKGQWNENVDFKITLNSGQLFLEKNSFTYNFINDDDLVQLHESRHHKNETPPETIHNHVLKVNFVNSNNKCDVMGLSPFETNYNYFIGKDSKKWASEAKAYRGVKYENIYQDIDMYLYEKGGNLKYDFVLPAGINPNQIIIQYEGAESIIAENGNIKITTSVNYIIEKKPVAYQLINGLYTEVECTFISSRDNQISFYFPNGYDKTKELIIDPELIFSTYSGSYGDNWGYTATYDAVGNAYSGGIAYSGGGSYSGYPLTTGAIQTTYSGGISDVAISKYSSDGANLLYATYLGGSGDDNPMSMIVNNNDELVIVGNTSSINFPVANNTFDNLLNNGGGGPNGNNSDIFVTVISTSGGGLLGSSYVGGVGNDGLNSLAYFYGDEHRSEVIVDSLNNIYVASNTNSNDFPATASSFDNSFNGWQDGCVFKMNSDASSMIWASYLGGSSRDQTSGIVLDNNNNVFVCGGTGGSGFPITNGTINQTYKGGNNAKGVSPGSLQADGYVSKISADGSTLLASTYLQSTTAVFDLAYLIKSDIDGNIYVSGLTEGAYPITSGVFNNGSSSQFLHKLNTDLTSTFFSTTYGSGSNNQLLSTTALMIDDCYRIYVAGWGGTISFAYSISNDITGFPISSNAIQPITDGEDFYFAVFNKDMSNLNYATYFGGNQAGEHVDGGTSRFSPEGIVYQAVCAGCGGNSTFPSTAGVYSTTNNSNNCNAALFKIEVKQNVVEAEITESYDDTVYCANTSLLLNNASTNANKYVWYFGDGDSLHTSSDSSVYHFFDKAGNYSVMLISSNDGICFSKPRDTTYYTIKMIDPPIADAGKDTIITNCEEYQLKGCCGSNVKFRWLPDVELSDNDIQNPIATPNAPITYYLEVENEIGCIAIDSVFIDVEKLRVEIPNIITPNGDGYNDYFVINGVCEESKITLYNRWGKEVYQRLDYENKFDGADLNDGTYYYLIESEGEEFKGWLQILR